MPPGEVTDPKSKDGFLKSGYLRRYDLYEDEETPSKMPIVGVQKMKKGDPVLFDIGHATLSANGETYFIPVAFLRDKSTYNKIDWEAEWEEVDKKADGIVNEEKRKEVKDKIALHKKNYKLSESV